MGSEIVRLWMSARESNALPSVRITVLRHAVVKLRLRLLACAVATALVLFLIPLDLHAQQQSTISKKDADLIFSLTKAEWKSNAHKFFARGFEIKLREQDSGTEINAYDPSSGYGISVRPIYLNDQDKPEMLIVGNYVPLGFLPPMTDDFKRAIEATVLKDLGPVYSARLTHSRTESSEVIEISINRPGRR